MRRCQRFGTQPRRRPLSTPRWSTRIPTLRSSGLSAAKWLVSRYYPPFALLSAAPWRAPLIRVVLLARLWHSSPDHIVCSTLLDDRRWTDGATGGGGCCQGRRSTAGRVGHARGAQALRRRCRQRGQGRHFMCGDFFSFVCVSMFRVCVCVFVREWVWCASLPFGLIVIARSFQSINAHSAADWCAGLCGP